MTLAKKTLDKICFGHLYFLVQIVEVGDHAVISNSNVTIEAITDLTQSKSPPVRDAVY